MATLPPFAIHWKLSMSAVESHAKSPVSQMAKRTENSWPPLMGAVVLSHVVAPASWFQLPSKPLP